MPFAFWLENRTDNRMPKREKAQVQQNFYMMTVKTPKPVGFGVFVRSRRCFWLIAFEY